MEYQIAHRGRLKGIENSCFVMGFIQPNSARRLLGGYGAFARCGFGIACEGSICGRMATGLLLADPGSTTKSKFKSAACGRRRATNHPCCEWSAMRIPPRLARLDANPIYDHPQPVLEICGISSTVMLCSLAPSHGQLRGLMLKTLFAPPAKR